MDLFVGDGNDGAAEQAQGEQTAARVKGTGSAGGSVDG